mgnify:FL=1
MVDKRVFAFAQFAGFLCVCKNIDLAWDPAKDLSHGALGGPNRRTEVAEMAPIHFMTGFALRSAVEFWQGADMLRRWTSLLGLLGCVGCAFVVSGCHDGVSPRLIELRYDGQAPDVSAILLFTLVFEDDNGDLGEGRLETLINNGESGLDPLDLAPLFVRADIPLSSTAGELPFEVEVGVGRDPQDWPAPDTSITLGARAVDAAENVSNLAEVDLVFR